MREPTAIHATHRRAIRIWLWSVAALIFAMVLVGGATRLTESGLSITEWQPVTGALPPMSDTAWTDAFTKYQAIPQYQKLNRGMTLGEFKTIYWWEWTHRLLGRLIGAAFLLPFLFFLWRGYVEPGRRGRLWAIFGLGAAQGAVGWWMVASGLADRVEVSQYRLAFHLTLACVIYVAIVWTAEQLRERPAVAVPARLRFGAVALVVLVLAQIYLGALVAGLRAGLIYNTWPTIDGAFIPDAAHLFFNQPAWRNVFENTLTVQFDHRMMAYTVLIVALLHAVDTLLIRHGIRAPSPRARGEGRGEGASPRFVVKDVLHGDSAPLTPTLSPQERGEGAQPLCKEKGARASTAAATGAVWLALAVTAQAALGIATLLNQAPLGLALAHQGLALVVLTLATLHAARVVTAVTPQPAPAPGPR